MSGGTTSAGRVRTGQPIVGTAVPRSTLPPTVIVPPPPVYWTYGAWPAIGVGWYASPFWSVYSGGGSAAYGAADPTGGLRLQIDQKDAQVFVDGDFAGTVDEVDGRFHHLNLPPGPHHIEVRAPGYRPLELDVDIQPRHTIDYRGALLR
jgi:hypothetical protein